MGYEQFLNSNEIEQELKRERYKIRYKKILKSTIYAMVTAAAVAVLIATLWMPVLRIYGSSMNPTLKEGEIVVSVKTEDMKPGDIVAFYSENKVLVKRYIAGPGSWVNIMEDGTVIVDGVELDEPYVTEKSFGISDLEFPYQIPENTYFLMGDHRDVSVDSRHSSVGCIKKDQIVGKIVFHVWPLNKLGVL